MAFNAPGEIDWDRAAERDGGPGPAGGAGGPKLSPAEMLDHASGLILELQEMADRGGFPDLAAHLALAYAEARRSRRRLPGASSS